MTLVTRADDLATLLGSRNERGVDAAMANRAQTITGLLNEVGNTNKGAASFREDMQVTGIPDIDKETLDATVRAFRDSLESSGLSAVQRPEGADLEEKVSDQGTKVKRWCKAVWRNSFDCDELLGRAERLGRGTLDRKAKAHAAKLFGAKTLDPLSEVDEINGKLGADNRSQWSAKIGALVTKLKKAVENAEAAVAELDDDVRAFITRAATDGFPLKEMTAALLKKLSNAEKLDDYEVKPDQ